MPIVASDWTVALNGDVRYVGDAHGGASPSYATAIELYRFLQALADDQEASGDDLLSITEDNPGARATDNFVTLINGMNIDDLAAEHIYDGTIVQANGDTIYDAVVNFGNTTFIMLMQNGALIANDFWNNGPTPGVFNPDAGQNISHRFLVKVRDAGADIDGRRLLGLTRNLGFSWAEFPINGTARGNNVLALSEQTDLNNQTLAATIATWVDVVNTEGFAQIDVTGDGSDEDYYSAWDYGSRSVNEFYERLKWLARQGSGETLYGLSGEIFRGITHEIDIDNPTGDFNAVEPVSWATGTGQMLAIDNETAGTKMWIQLLTGVAPTDGQTITGGTSGATADVNILVQTRNVATPFVGQSTGSAIIGAFGLGVLADDLAVNDDLTDLGGTLREPPNNVLGVVSGLVIGEDYVLVTPRDGSAIDTDQMSLAATLNGAAVASIQMAAAIPTDTPAAGTIRVVDDAGVHRFVPYASYSGDTFTLSGTVDFSGTAATAGNDAYVTYLDKLATATSESWTSVYNADRDVLVRARDGGASPIVPYEAQLALTAAGMSAPVIRTSDA